MLLDCLLLVDSWIYSTPSTQSGYSLMPRLLETPNQPMLLLSHAVETSTLLTQTKGRYATRRHDSGNVRVATNSRKIVSIGYMAIEVNSYVIGSMSAVSRRRIQTSHCGRPRHRLAFIERQVRRFAGRSLSISGGIS